MGRKSGSYKFEKRQKELKKQKKKREKLERRMNKGAEVDEEPQPTAWIGGTFDDDEDLESDSEFDDDEDLESDSEYDDDNS